MSHADIFSGTEIHKEWINYTQGKNSRTTTNSEIK
jgi:hypothetical protein